MRRSKEVTRIIFTASMIAAAQVLSGCEPEDESDQTDSVADSWDALEKHNAHSNGITANSWFWMYMLQPARTSSSVVYVPVRGAVPESLFSSRSFSSRSVSRGGIGVFGRSGG